MPLPLLSRPTDTTRANSPSSLATPALKHSIPTIRLVAATPGPSDTNYSIIPWSAPQPPPTLAPKASSLDTTPYKCLVPKESNLGILSLRETDLSDVVRHVGASKGMEARVSKFMSTRHSIVVVKEKIGAELDGMG